MSRSTSSPVRTSGSRPTRASKHVGTADTSGWFLQNGLRGLAGAQVAVFGKSVVGYQSVLFDLHDERPMP